MVTMVIYIPVKIFFLVTMAMDFTGKTIHKEIMIMNIMENVLFVTVIINLTGRYFIGKHDCDSYRLGIYLTSITRKMFLLTKTKRP